MTQTTHKRITTSTLTPNSLYNDSFWHGHQASVSINNGRSVVAVFGMRHKRNIISRFHREGN